MSKGWHYKPSDWNIICDVCGTKVKASESKRRWDGLVVCSKDYETRHPMDFIRAKIDKIAVPFVRKDPTIGRNIQELDQAVVFSCNHINLGIADEGGADFAHADFDSCADLSSVLQNPLNSSAVAGLAISGYSVTGNSFLGQL